MRMFDFVGWLRSHNDSLNPGQSIGFYGLDLYSLHASIEAVISYLDKVDPEAARCARYRYGCFEHFGEDPQTYGYCAGFGLTHTCESEVIAQLVDLQRHAFEYARMDGRVATERLFNAQQNAQLIRDAEHYYRTMFRGRVSSWNLRDQHMAETLDSLVGHLDRRHQPENRRGPQFASRRCSRHANGPSGRMERWAACPSEIWQGLPAHRLQHIYGDGDSGVQQGQPGGAKGGAASKA